MKPILAGVALSALLFASGANAANYTLDLTGDFGGLITNSFVSGGTLYETGVLALSGFTPFILQNGDTVDVTVAITGGPFSLPLRQQMFLGLNFDDVFTGAQPLGAVATGTFAFDGGPLVGVGCGNCTSLIYGQDNTPLSFTQLAATGAFTLDEDYAVNFVSVSYQVSGPSGAVPEPAAWAMMIMGFGGVGAIVRRRRQTIPLAAFRRG